MKSETVKQLLALNRDLYGRLADSFSRSRPVEHLALDPMVPFVTQGSRVLDLGCGNGRAAEWLDRAGFQVEYAGVDQSASLLDEARRRAATYTHVHARFSVLDLADPDWSGSLLTLAPFDLALALAVLHHLPGHALRRTTLAEIARLLQPGGALVMSNWQFTHSSRLRNKIVTWDTVGLNSDQVELGDFLLDWKRGGEGYRYVHQFTRDEIEHLARECGFAVVEQHLAEAGMNLWSILRKG